MLIAVLDGYLIFLTITNERILIPVQHRLIGFRGYPGIHTNLGPKASPVTSCGCGWKVIHIHIHMDEKWSIFTYIWMKNDPYSTYIWMKSDPYIHICMDVKRCWFCRVNLLVMENSLGTPTHASIIFLANSRHAYIVGYLVHSVDLKKILFQNTWKEYYIHLVVPPPLPFVLNNVLACSKNTIVYKLVFLGNFFCKMVKN
jgi:hypothetical protein